MTQVKISELPVASSATVADLIPIVQSGVTKQLTNAKLFTNATLIAPVLGTPASGTLTNCIGLPIDAGTTGTLPISRGGTGGTTYTGTGNIVFSNSPNLVTPSIGTPSVGTLTNCTGLPISTGVSGLGTSVATALTVNVGSAGAVLVNGGVLGTPSSGTLTNCTGLPISTGVSGLAANIATFLTTPSSANLAAALTDETGTGVAVFNAAPTINSLAMGFGATKTASFSLGATDDYIVCNGAAANVAITLPAANTCTGRAIHVKNISATYTVISAASDVVPLAGGAAGTAILAATAGKWAIVVSNGTNWEIMAAN